MIAIFRHLIRIFGPARLGQRAFIGVVLFILNVPIGWGGAALCALMAGMDKKHAILWSACSAGVYALSWGLLFLGAFMAGKSTINAFKKRVPMAFAAYKRLKNTAVP